MKRYHLFAGDTYYPQGFEDYVGSFDTQDDAITAFDAWSKIHGASGVWSQVIYTQDDGSLILVRNTEHAFED